MSSSAGESSDAHDLSPSSSSHPHPYHTYSYAHPPATSPPSSAHGDKDDDVDPQTHSANANNNNRDKSKTKSKSKSGDSNKTSTSILGHLTYPISYTTTALLRRLSEDSAPTPLARALSANYNGSMFEATSSLYNPPSIARRHSPFQPPPLTPLTLEGYSSTTSVSNRLLSPALAEEIRLLVPPRLQLVDTWRLSYSLEQNGSSLRSLYKSLDPLRGRRGGFVLVIRDTSGGVFGGYLSDAPVPAAHFYGTGESFLWRAFRLPALPELSDLPPPPSEDTEHMVMGRSTTIGGRSNGSKNGGTSTGGTNTPERIRFKAFPYTGENDYVLFCQAGFLSVGGGDGKYGLWLDDGLAKGVSATCPTFMNENLSDEGDKFGVLGVEVWYLGA